MVEDGTMSIPMVAENWFNTVSGLKVSLVQPDPSAIIIEDIAIALGNIGRFSGQTHRYFSVADHCLLVSHLVENFGQGLHTHEHEHEEEEEHIDLPRSYVLAGLLHDASEAYLGDVTSPLKVLLPEYRRIEDNMLAVILDRFGLPSELPDEVIEADHQALKIESRFLFKTHDEWHLPYKGPMGVGEDGQGYGMVDLLNPAHPRLAGKRFLQRFKELTD